MMLSLGVSDVRRRLLSLISCFAGGVFLATCLLDLLPDYLQGIGEAFSSAGIKVRPPTDLRGSSGDDQGNICGTSVRIYLVLWRKGAALSVKGDIPSYFLLRSQILKMSKTEMFQLPLSPELHMLSSCSSST